MTKQSIARAWGNKVVACVCAATMAATMVAVPAFGGTQKAYAATDYNPIGINFDSTNIYTMIDTMYNLASAGDQIAAESNGTKQLRYGSATDIAKQFEKYVKGLQGYVLKNASAKKAVALVKNYDAASGTYELVPTGVAEGTATANRYLEAVQNVAVNLGDSKTTATKDDLAGVNLIMLGSQSGKENLLWTVSAKGARGRIGTRSPISTAISRSASSTTRVPIWTRSGSARATPCSMCAAGRVV